MRLLKAAEGVDVFLDTAVRFMAGNENDVENARPSADKLFRLLEAGARCITGAHHAPKGFEGQDYMGLQNILRGSGDIGAMCWGVRQIDAARNQLYVENIKPRDFQPCAPFIVEGRPRLDETGQFKMLQEPGEAEELRSYLRQKGGRPAVTDKAAKLSQAVVAGTSTVGNWTTRGFTGYLGGGATAAPAQSSLTLTSNVAANSTVTIGSTTYTFQTAAPISAGEVQIGIDSQTTLHTCPTP